MNHQNITVEPAALLRRLADWSHEIAERSLIPEATLTKLGATLEQSLGERLDAPTDAILVVMLCGPTTAGKSTLLNALAGDEISRTGLGATTGSATLYVHEQDDPARLFEYGKALGEMSRRPQTVIRHRCDGLLHKVIVDTPDIDSVKREHRELTESLVYTADLILFVTTPGKYKDLEGAEWICRQRGQRAMAFVINKWDRDGIGRQYDDRDVVERDFRQMLAKRGFQDACLFKISARKWLERDASRVESGPQNNQDETQEFPRLVAWLEQGLDRSASAAIQDRRRRAGWGRLVAAITAAVPDSLDGHPWIAASERALDESRLESQELMLVAVARAADSYTDGSLWPATPGLLGIYIAWLAWFSAALQRLAFLADASKSPLAWPRRNAGSQPESLAYDEPTENHFGDTVAKYFHDTTWRLLADPGTRKIPLEPVRSGWIETTNWLASKLHNMPERIVSGALLTASRFSLRRAAGFFVFYLVEITLAAVLVLTIWRVGLGFATGVYVDGSLILSASALIAALLLFGHMMAKLFFPSLRIQLRKSLESTARETIEDAWQAAQGRLNQHVQDTSRLAQQGREFLRQIEAIIHSLAKPLGGELGELFGDQSTATLQCRHGASRHRRPSQTSRQAQMYQLDLELRVRRNAAACRAWNKLSAQDRDGRPQNQSGLSWPGEASRGARTPRGWPRSSYLNEPTDVKLRGLHFQFNFFDFRRQEYGWPALGCMAGKLPWRAAEKPLRGGGRHTTLIAVPTSANRRIYGSARPWSPWQCELDSFSHRNSSQ